MHKISTFLTNASFVLLIILMIGIPFIFFPTLENFFDTPKYVLLFVGAVVSFLFWGRQVLAEKQLRISTHAFLLPLLLLSVGIIISSFFTTDSLFDSFWTINGMLVLAALTIIFLSTVLTTIRVSVIKEVLLSVGIVTTLISALQAVGIGPSTILNTFLTLKMNPDFRFAFTGSPLASLTLLIPIFVLGLTSLFKTKNWKSSVFDIIAVIMIGAGIGLHVFMMWPGKIATPILLPFTAQWLLFAEFIKSPLRLFFGYGPGGFADAFTVLRPAQLNATQYWNIIFQSGSNALFTLAFTSGLLATLGWISWFFVLLFQIPKSRSHEYFPFGIALLSLFIMHLFIPLSVISVLLLVVFSVVWIVGRKESGNQLVELIFHPKMLVSRLGQHSEHSSQIFVIVVISALFIMMLFPMWYVVKQVVGEFFLYKSSIAVQANDGKGAYENIQKAVSWNPQHAPYRLTYAKTNFLLAQNLSQKKDLTDEQKNNIATLMQQAVREVRLAAQLAPSHSQYWREMAQIYRSLVGSVKDADQFTLAAYSQAIQFSPTDPSLRLDLGSLFLQQKNYEQAALFFEQATTLKPDYANAYYNWGKALELQNKYEPAVAAYKQALRIAEADTTVAENQKDQIAQVKKDLDTVSEKLATEQKAAAQKAATAKSKQPQTTPQEKTDSVTPTSEEPQPVDKTVDVGTKEDVLNTEPQISTPAATTATPTP